MLGSRRIRYWTKPLIAIFALVRKEMNDNELHLHVINTYELLKMVISVCIFMFFYLHISTSRSISSILYGTPFEDPALYIGVHHIVWAGFQGFPWFRACPGTLLRLWPVVPVGSLY